MTVQRMRGTVLILLAWVAGAALMLVSAAPATGHAMLIGTDPTDGDVLPDSPPVVTLTFNEAVQVQEDGVRVLDAEGEPLPTQAASVDATVEAQVPPELTNGTYIVDWRVTSADGHPVSGAFTFSVGAPSADVAEVAPTESSGVVDVLHQGAQVLVYLGLLGATGLVLFTLVLLDRGAGAVRGRLRQLATVLGGVAVLGLLLSVLTDGAWQTGAGPGGLVDARLIGDTLTSATGLAVGLALVGLALALGLADRASGARRVSWPVLLAAGGALLALVSLTLTGHTRTYGPAWLVVGSDVLHVLAGSIWFGGVLGLLLTLRHSRVPTPGAARTVARFSAAAAWIVLLLAATGTVLAWRILPGLGALVTTGYGLTLIAKVAVVAVIVAIAAWNRFRLVPQAEGGGEDTATRARLRRTVGAEAGLLLVVLAFTGFLVSQSPTEADEETVSAAQPVSYQEPLGEAVVDVEVSPAAAGANLIELSLTDADGAALEPEEDPEVRLSLPDVGIGPLVPVVSSTGTGTYEVELDIPLAGDWELEVSARTSTYENPAVTLPLPVAP